MTTRSVRVMIGAGTVFLIGGVWVSLRDLPDGRPLAAAGLAIAAFGIFVASVPLFFCWRLLVTLRDGALGSAEVLQLRFECPSDATVDSMYHGMARGSWRVSVADGRTFDESFEVDEAFARQLRISSHVQVLVHPRDLKTLFNLALLERTTETVVYRGDGHTAAKT